MRAAKVLGRPDLAETVQAQLLARHPAYLRTELRGSVLANRLLPPRRRRSPASKRPRKPSSGRFPRL